MTRAFTLVELMVVVTVIGIGGAVAAFNMADQVRDARASADTRTAIEDLRKEHRQAREQMLGLKVVPLVETTPGSGPVSVITYQLTRGADCVEPIGAARVKTYKYAQLSVVPSSDGVCFAANGQPVVPAAPGNQAGEAALTVKANLSGADRMVFTALRVERSGITEIVTRKTSSSVVAAVEAALQSDFQSAVSMLAGPIRGVVVNPSGAGAGEAPLHTTASECVDVTGALTTCVNLL
jgi:prepilin-type N-terminal cleavage/methylation domain-containing protein